MLIIRSRDELEEFLKRQIKVNNIFTGSVFVSGNSAKLIKNVLKNVISYVDKYNYPVIFDHFGNIEPDNFSTNRYVRNNDWFRGYIKHHGLQEFIKKVTTRPIILEFNKMLNYEGQIWQPYMTTTCIGGFLTKSFEEALAIICFYGFDRKCCGMPAYLLIYCENEKTYFCLRANSEYMIYFDPPIEFQL